MKMLTCCICRKQMPEMQSHNPYPVRAYSSIGQDENRCCEDCNANIVLPARIYFVKASEEEMKGIHEQLKQMSYEEFCNK